MTATGDSAPASMTCPKCGETQRPAEACRRCGLMVANWDPAKADEVFGDVREAQALWQELEGAWDDGARHAGFIEHCRARGSLPFAAARERRAGARPGAAERLGQIRVIAEQTLAAMPRTQPPKKTSRRLVLLVALVMLLALGWLLVQLLGRGAP